ncbi:MAG: isopeptide-forming domain-containing fimbrial protein [Gammaproteobacteria bacterium]|nr:isopeptide-forming domain-containing fimbrial protein [Gammaproteobacteria bacterium]
MSLPIGAPAGCTALIGAPAGRVPPTLAPREVWPPDLPGTSTVYRCAAGTTIASGATNTYTFRVQKQGAGTDLTFRADLIGEIVLADNSSLSDFPAIPAPGFINYASNYYSLDSVRARIIGFNLANSLPNNCSEDAAPVVPLENVEIGEDCRYHINAEWFGFETPGFGNITVEQIVVSNTFEPGLGFVAAQPPVGMTIASSTLPAQFATAPAATFNLDPILDHLADPTAFDIDIDGRLLNDPLNVFGTTAPNYHGEDRTSEANASFRVYFDRGGPTETFIDFNNASPGYPPVSQREVDVNVTEPNLTVSKTICNRTLTPACAPADFTAAATGGDADDVYIVRIRLFNDDTAGADFRATAYDVSVSSLMDPDAVDDLLIVQPVASDLLDNDGDGLADPADTDEAANIILTNNAVGDGQGQIDVVPTFDIASGATVDLYYQLDVDDSAIPGQSFDLSTTASFDSLNGASGNQNPASASGSASGARQYTNNATATLTVSSISIATPSKGFIDKSNIADVPFAAPVPPAATTADVTPGEEVEVQLSVEVPISTLRNFTISDVLPAGMRCVEARDLVFSTTPDANGLRFTTAGTYSATGCPGSGTITWQATAQHILEDTTLPASNDTYTLSVSFIARIDNVAGNVAGTAIINGDDNGAAAGVGAGTDVVVSYDDEQIPPNTISLSIPSATVTVREPNIQLTVATGTANLTPPPLVNNITAADAGDVYTVAVTIDNDSITPVNLSPAYNLRVVADLTAIPGATYVAGSLNETGTNPGTFTVTTAGPTQLVLDYNNTSLDPAETLSFTFDVLLPNNVQPHDVLQTAVTASYSSLASNAIALNTGGVIGVDNAPDGMRLYSLTQTDVTASVPALQTAKTEAALSNPVATIGARKRFQIEIAFPEGVTSSPLGNRLTISDNLAAAGSSTSYVFENNTGFPIQYEFFGIQSINGAVDPAQFASQITAPADGSVNTVSWTFNGDVVTEVEEDLDVAPDSIDPVIRITYYARIDDNAATNAGDTLVNSALTNYVDRALTARSTAAASVGPFTVVEPDLRMDKSASATINFGTPETYSLDIRNDGASAAWNATITDIMVEPTPGGMCDTPPANITAQIQDDFGALRRNLSMAGPTPDYSAVFAGDPTCTLTINMLTNNARIDDDEHLVVTYEAALDLDNVNGAQLDNIAGVTRYFSLEQVDAAARTYSNALSPDYATAVAAVAFEDHEDAHRITVGAPQLVITQSVVNPASPPGVLAAPIVNPIAQPGDTLRYQIHIVNQGALPINGFNLTEDLDLLNPGSGFYLVNSLNVVAAAGGNDFSNPSGGSKATGLIDIQNLNIAADNVGDTDELVIHYDVTLVPVITNGTQVLNQSLTNIAGFSTVLSDDPDPGLLGATDPTVLVIDSRPIFLVSKTAQDLTGDPNSLQAGDILRYTITVKNIGQENSTNVLLQDLIPANTSYVADSVTLNGAPVATPDNGVSPLQNGILINAPENTTAGFMQAVAASATTNIATITFDVMLDIDLVNGAVISNQAFVTGQGIGSGVFGTSPSDDPATPVVGDPTRNVVGNLPILEVQKTVDFAPGGDTNLDGIIDPGESLRYTISVQNLGDSNATGVRLIDVIPVADIAYVLNSLQLNGDNVPDGGVNPLNAGIDISSDDLTLPLPLPNQGQITAGQTATISFDVTVDGTKVPGDLISNQALVSSNELSDELSDADGDPSNGNQPTVFVVGNVQSLSISKNVFVVDGGLATPGKQLEYVVRVENIGTIPATDIVVSDLVPANLNYVTNSVALNGAATGTSFTSAPDTITANYAATYNDLDAGESFTVRFRATIDPTATIGTTIINTATVSWNAGANTDNASVQIDVGGAPGVGTLTGQVWNDADHNNIFDAGLGDRQLPNWTVEIYLNNIFLDSAITDAQGNYRFLGVPVSDASNDYDLVFIAEGGNASSAALGTTNATKGMIGLHRIDDFNVNVGEAVFNQNLPIEPNGVIYNSLLRSVIPGATVRLLNPSGNLVPVSCFPANSNQQNQVTTTGGYYKFDLNFTDPVSCPNNASYTIEVIPPAQGYTAGTSVLVPPANDFAVYDVPSCSGDVNTATPECEIQAQIQAPNPAAAPNSAATRYYLVMMLANAPPVDNQAYNNHIPVDPDEFPAGGISISKTSPLINVNRGQLVPYVIRVTNNLDVSLFNMEVRDRIPAGFKFVQDSSRIQDPTSVPETIKGAAAAPTITGLQLSWDELALAAGETITLKMLLIVGSGVGEGEYVNTATAYNAALQIQASETASATVRVVPDPTFDCSDVIGKVFDDDNLNGYQDEGEKGIAGARVVTARGVQLTTDEHGRFHITCAVVPNMDRGSNFILKLDDRSLPTGYRVTTENPRVQRATRGKMLKYNFGAAIHRVVRLDMADAVFEENTTDMRPQWKPRLDMLISELAKDPSVLRLSYLAENEDEDLVDDRLESVKQIIVDRWDTLNCCYKLMIETEVFWRRGGPPDRGEFDD